MAARRDRGMTQRELARALGVCEDTIVNWEKGHHPPQLRHWRKYARLLGLSVPDLRLLVDGRACLGVLLAWGWWL